MARGVVNKFNRGEIDVYALARDDVKRVNNSARSMINFIPMRLGPMIYRPGTEYLHTFDAGTHRMVPFIAAVDDTAVIDFYDVDVKFVLDDDHVATTSVTSTITNTDFTTNITGWTTVTPGSTSVAWYDYGTGDGAAALTGDGVNNAVMYQTIGATDTDEEHFIRIIIERAPVVLKLGTSGVSSSDIFSGTLKPGEHVLAFTPTSNITVTFENSKKYRTLINSVDFDGAADLKIGTDMTSTTITSLRSVQSGDIVFCAYNDGAPFQIEHRGDKSWSVVDFRSNDGPFELINDTEITMTPAAISGDTTLTASDDFFESGHVGALFKVASSGQTVTQSATAVDVVTNSIRVFGVDNGRIFNITLSGFGTATVTLQRSADDSTWEDITTYTANTNVSYDDALDNAILYYRLKVTAYTAGTIVMTLTYAAGSIEGICRVTKYTSATVVEVQVVRDLGDTDATRDWYEGSWSDVKQYPTAVELSEGRLWFGGKDISWGSVSDAYYSFDRDIVGDSASIKRTIGFGPTDPIKWLKEASKLVIATASDELSIRSNSFGDVMTPSNATIKSGSTQGADDNDPVRIDGLIYYVQRSGTKVFSLQSYIEQDTFSTLDINLLNQDICDAGITRLAVVRQPETRIIAVLDDGNVAIYTVDKSEEIAAWSRLQVDGNVKDVVVLPDTSEDRIYFVVERVIDLTTYLYLEKMAKFSEAKAGTVSKTFDSFKTYTAPGATITGLSHLEGETVGVWADGQDRGTYTVSGGEITVSSAWSQVVVGLPYTADYISNKLSGYDPVTVLTERKRIVDTGVALVDYWPGALKIGPSVDLLGNLPGVEDGTDLDTTATISEYNELPFEFDGETESDPRIYMRATGPVTVLALTYGVEDDSLDSSSKAE